MFLEWWWWTITFSYSSIYKSVQQHINNRDRNWKKNNVHKLISAKRRLAKKKNTNEEESPQHKLNSINRLELPIAKKNESQRFAYLLLLQQDHPMPNKGIQHKKGWTKGPTDKKKRKEKCSQHFLLWNQYICYFFDLQCFLLSKTG